MQASVIRFIYLESIIMERRLVKTVPLVSIVRLNFDRGGRKK